MTTARLVEAGAIAQPRRSEAVRRAVHPERPPVGPPLTWDDLLDLQLLLMRDDWYEQCVQ